MYFYLYLHKIMYYAYTITHIQSLILYHINTARFFFLCSLFLKRHGKIAGKLSLDLIQIDREQLFYAGKTFPNFSGTRILDAQTN